MKGWSNWTTLHQRDLKQGTMAVGTFNHLGLSTMSQNRTEPVPHSPIGLVFENTHSNFILIIQINIVIWASITIWAAHDDLKQHPVVMTHTGWLLSQTNFFVCIKGRKDLVKQGNFATRVQARSHDRVCGSGLVVFTHHALNTKLIIYRLGYYSMITHPSLPTHTSCKDAI